MIQKIAIIGSGNMATNLGFALKNADFQIVQVFSRNISNAEKLGNLLQCNFINNLSLISQDVDLYIVAVSDNVISDVLNNFPVKDKLIVHTAGSVDIEVFGDKFSDYGVFYPLQSFTKIKIVDFQNIPVFIEANKEENLLELRAVADKISSNVQIINTKERLYLHLAAVFANNFTNFMLTLSRDILAGQNLKFDTLLPLVKETVQRLENSDPHDMQTGPAIRGDKKIISNHLQLLSDSPDLEKIYRFVTENICNYYSKKKE